jgi:hypothetical protein
MPESHGTAIAQRDVTIVSFNYRLGAFAFLDHPEAGGNFAVQDWIAALTWVAHNIRAFGGDPDNVTIHGDRQRPAEPSPRQQPRNRDDQLPSSRRRQPVSPRNNRRTGRSALNVTGRGGGVFAQAR